MRRLIPTTLAVVAVLCLPVAPAVAAIAPDRDPARVAGALADGLPPGAFAGASFVTIAPIPTAECANGVDDDLDGLVDAGNDPGCESGATDNREADDPPPDENPACANGQDDDGDDRIDLTDPGCSSATDPDEGSEGLPLPQVNPAAVASSALAGFPSSGGSYAILSSGNVLFADDPDGDNASADNRGGPGSPPHGDGVDDLVTLKVDVDVPSGVNCLRTDFRFFSEEVAGTFNDAFVAELDQSDFTVGGESSVSAPHNFAFDTGGGLISVNTASFSASEAAGTTYDGATARLRASTPITPGRHSIYFSVFDVGDEILDSAVFIDAMRLTDAPGDACASGASADVTAPVVGLTSPAGGSSSADATPHYAGAAGDAPGDSGTVTVEVFAGGAAAGSPIQSLPVARSGGSWATEGPPLSPGTYTARATQSDGAGNVGFSAPSTFTVTSAAAAGGGDGGGQDPLPRPVTGKLVNVEPVKGVVTVRLPGGRILRLQDAEQIPTGSVIDTRRGTVRLYSTGRGGTIQSALFFAGLFRVTQTTGAKPRTDLKLVEKLARCPRPDTARGAARRKKKRRLWGDGSGAFRTSGRRSAATVSGTRWLVQDDCAGTLTRVTRGKVRVRDFKRKKTVTVRAGRSYRAR